MSETNNLREVTGMSGQEYHDQFVNAPSVAWTDPALKRFVRVRLLTDPGFPMYDVSYVYGELHGGTLCHVILPFHQIPKRGFASWLIKQARGDKVYLKGLGFFDALSKLT